MSIWKYIENFLNSNKNIVGKLKCCYHEHYKGLDIFKFLPGHNALLKSIPNQIEKINKRTDAVEKGNKNVKCPAKAALTGNEFKTGLVKTLMKISETAAKSQNIEIASDVITDVNIVEFKRGSTESNFICKTRFNCPYCSKSFGLNYKRFWSTSHVSAHLKEHFMS